MALRNLVPPPPHRGVPGVSKSALWASWKEIRKKLRDSSLRDIVDCVEYDVDPEKWILRLRNQVLGGRYEPQRPLRFPLGKSKGLSRWMTLPAVPDLVLFHAIATRIVKRVQRRRRRHRHVYFAIESRRAPHRPALGRDLPRCRGARRHHRCVLRHVPSEWRKHSPRSARRQGRERRRQAQVGSVAARCLRRAARKQARATPGRRSF
ncbi:MAG TPA: hypothetical protein VEK07_18810 [Polyangiaceae bacterium]|nr:hypothetical protein [Polyangiaceae bacterium]